MKTVLCVLMLVAIAASAAIPEEKKTEKRGVLGLGYGGVPVNHGLGLYSNSLIGHNVYGGSLLGGHGVYGGGLLGHGVYGGGLLNHGVYGGGILGHGIYGGGLVAPPVVGGLGHGLAAPLAYPGVLGHGLGYLH